MTDRFNPASRVAQALEAANRHPQDTQTVEVWGVVFGIEESNQHKKAREVSKALDLLSNEISLIAEQVNSGVAGAPERYTDALRNAQRATNVMDFSPGFQQCKRYINDHEINLLRLVSDHTPDEERVDEDNLSEVKDRLEELRAYAVENLEGAFRAFVLRQTQIMAEAIRRYPVVGVKAFKDGVDISLANLVRNKDVYNEASDEEAKSKLRDLVRKFYALAPRLVQVAQVINAADTIREITGN